MTRRGVETSDVCVGVETLADFVEGRIAAHARARVEGHAARCTACRQILSALARSGTPEIARLTPPTDLGVITAGTQIGRYVVLCEIGAGGMGVVYAAHDPELDRVVAIKVVRGDSDQKLRDRLRREAQAMAQLAHPHVVGVHDVGAFEGRLFIAMEYVPGETLARWATTPRALRAILDAYCAAGRGLAAAHAVGIVHRDFKPENVLIGSDGRVRVGDFGLARTGGAAGGPHGTATAEERSDMAVDARPAAPGALTAAGTLLGTPYYMAPELWGGAEATARSDQFSFCIALSSALLGERPADGAPRAASTGGSRRPHVPLPARRIPRRIRAALQRGLSTDPAARFASLDELLVELTPPPSRPVRWVIGFGAALLVAGWLVAWPSEVPDQRCTGADAAFATTWNAERRGAIATAFTATHAPYAPASLRHVTDELDRYAAQWRQAHTAACRATRILGEQTEPALELRMTCLERRRQEVAALVGTLAEATADVVTRSVDAAVDLTPVSACADLTTLRQIVAAPTDPAKRARLSELTARLAAANARYTTGALASALTLVRPITADAHELGYLPFEAEARLLQGAIEYDLDDMAHAEATLEAAVWAAEAGRSDEVAGFALVRQMFLLGLIKMEFSRAEALAPRVTAVIARLGGDDPLETYLERALGRIELRQEKVDSAVSHMEKALALAERAFAPDHLKVGPAVETLGVGLLGQGRNERALEVLQRASQIYERWLGPEHPGFARSLHNIGNAHTAMRSYVLAEQEVRRSLAIRETALGSEHRLIPDTLVGLGRAVRGQGRVEEALAYDQRAVAIAERRFGPAHLLLGGPLFELGKSLGLLGRYSEADASLRRAQAIAGKVLGADCSLVILALAARGDILMRQSRWREAAALYEQALPVLERSPGTATELAGAVSQLSRAYVELHQPARALALLDRLSRALDRPASDVAAAADFTRARALWATGGDRARAHDLARQALAELRDVATARRDDVTRIEHWLGHHPRP